MKYSPLITRKLKGHTVSSIFDVLKAQALVRAHFRCQICNASARLKAHVRVGERENAPACDMLVLCESCYDLAQLGKRKRMQSRVGHALRLTCLLSLFLGTIIAIDLLGRLLPAPLFLLSLVCLYTVFLLEYLSTRWL